MLQGAAKNRRVELFLRTGSFEVPRRRRRSEIPRPPGEPALEDVADGDGEAGRWLTAQLAGTMEYSFGWHDQHCFATGGAGDMHDVQWLPGTSHGVKLDDDDNDGTADVGASADQMVQCTSMHADARCACTH